MKLPLQSQIRFMGRFWRFKPGFAHNYAIGHYLRAPFSLVRADAEQANFVSFSGLSHVLKIAVPCYLAQIAKAIVTFVAVYMVNVLRRPFARHVSPRKPMRELLSVMDSYGPIACGLRRSRRFPYKIGSLFMRKPCKDTRIGVVMERRAQMFNRAWWVHCHDNAFTIGGLK
jgi:hypothetical protein